jgi:hypothetical protein
MLCNCGDSDSEDEHDRDVVSWNISEFRNAAEVLGEMVAGEDARMAAHSRQSWPAPARAPMQEQRLRQLRMQRLYLQQLRAMQRYNPRLPHADAHDCARRPTEPQPMRNGSDSSHVPRRGSPTRPPGHRDGHPSRRGATSLPGGRQAEREPQVRDLVHHVDDRVQAQVFQLIVSE